MDEKQKPLRTAANRVKDIYNTYVRPEDKAESKLVDDVVTATTSTDINQVHVHHEDQRSPESGVNSTTENSVEVDASNGAVEPVHSTLLKVEKERDDLKDQLLRKIAEFENFRKRTEREKEQLSLYATERVFGRLIEVLDDLHAALDAGKKSDDYASMLSGLELIYSKALRLYAELGVRPLVVEQNTVFNVDVHEALMHIPHPEVEEGLVVQQIQRGYTLHDKVLRHAKVVTSAGTGDAQ